MAFKEGYSLEEAQINMTLSTLAYASENNPTEIRKVLVEQLQITDYATKGEWELAWGPGLIINNSNMLYVVRHKKLPNRYAIAIRGTDPSFIFNILEDIEVVNLLPYTEAQPASGIDDICLAAGCWLGLQALTIVQGEDYSSGEMVTLLEFIRGAVNAAEGENVDIFITGHSLGGCLGNVLTTWLIDNTYRWQLPEGQINFKTYTFAAPTSGNQQYVDYSRWQFYEQTRINVESFRVNNKKDLVPYAWSSLEQVINDGIPTKFPSLLVPVVEAINNFFKQHQIEYVHIENAHPLEEIITPTDCNHILDIMEYMCWVMFEHATSTYLLLLEAPPVDEATLKTTEIVFS